MANINRENVKTKVLSLTNKDNSIKHFMQAEESYGFGLLILCFVGYMNFLKKVKYCTS